MNFFACMLSVFSYQHSFFISVQISIKNMDHGVFNISDTNLCPKLILVKLEVDDNIIKGK
jgi:hypothetical protein